MELLCLSINHLSSKTKRPLFLVNQIIYILYQLTFTELSQVFIFLCDPSAVSGLLARTLYSEIKITKTTAKKF